MGGRPLCASMGVMAHQGRDATDEVRRLLAQVAIDDWCPVALTDDQFKVLWVNDAFTTFGWEAEQAVERARESVAWLLKADPKEVVFTSGATESNNLAIKGLAGFYGSAEKDHFVTTQIEHKCVLDSF